MVLQLDRCIHFINRTPAYVRHGVVAPRLRGGIGFNLERRMLNRVANPIDELLCALIGIDANREPVAGDKGGTTRGQARRRVARTASAVRCDQRST